MKFNFLSLILMSLVFAEPVSFAATNGQILSVSDNTRQTMVSEYSKNVMSQAPEGYDNKQPSNNNPQQSAYERERDQIANQLTLFTENEDTKYVIVDGDTLTISYRDRGQLNRAAYKVSAKGEISVPIAGNIKVAGLNRRQARDRVDMMIKEYIREPRTTITINTDGKVMVFGAVGSPGVLEIKPQWTVLEAIMYAGGFNRASAEMANVLVIRGPLEKRSILKLNLKKLITKGDASDNIFVKPGDFVYIPMTVISNLELFWNTMSKPLMMWYGIGGTSPFNGGTWQWGGQELIGIGGNK